MSLSTPFEMLQTLRSNFSNKIRIVSSTITFSLFVDEELGTQLFTVFTKDYQPKMHVNLERLYGDDTALWSLLPRALATISTVPDEQEDCTRIVCGPRKFDEESTFAPVNELDRTNSDNDEWDKETSTYIATVKENGEYCSVSAWEVHNTRMFIVRSKNVSIVMPAYMDMIEDDRVRYLLTQPRTQENWRSLAPHLTHWLKSVYGIQRYEYVREMALHWYHIMYCVECAQQTEWLVRNLLTTTLNLEYVNPNHMHLVPYKQETMIAFCETHYGLIHDGVADCVANYNYAWLSHLQAVACPWFSCVRYHTFTNHAGVKQFCREHNSILPGTKTIDVSKEGYVVYMVTNRHTRNNMSSTPVVTLMWKEKDEPYVVCRALREKMKMKKCWHEVEKRMANLHIDVPADTLDNMLKDARAFYAYCLMLNPADWARTVQNKWVQFRQNYLDNFEVTPCDPQFDAVYDSMERLGYVKELCSQQVHIMVVGIPGCGKSSLARALAAVLPNAVRVNQDQCSGKREAFNTRVRQLSADSDIKFLIVDRCNSTAQNRKDVAACLHCPKIIYVQFCDRMYGHGEDACSNNMRLECIRRVYQRGFSHETLVTGLNIPSIISSFADGYTLHRGEHTILVPYDASLQDNVLDVIKKMKIICERMARPLHMNSVNESLARLPWNSFTHTPQTVTDDPLHKKMLIKKKRVGIFLLLTDSFLIRRNPDGSERKEYVPDKFDLYSYNSAYNEIPGIMNNYITAIGADRFREEYIMKRNEFHMTITFGRVQDLRTYMQRLQPYLHQPIAVCIESVMWNDDGIALRTSLDTHEDIARDKVKTRAMEDLLYQLQCMRSVSSHITLAYHKSKSAKECGMIAKSEHSAAYLTKRLYVTAILEYCAM